MAKKNSLRINLVSEYFYPANNAPSARFKPLVNELLAANMEVVIYTSKISSGIKEYSVKTNTIGFPSNQSSTLIRLLQEVLFGVETFVRLLFSKGEFYYITSPSFINCILAYWYCRLLNKKYILDIRDDYPGVYFDSNLISEKGIIGKMLFWMEKKIYKHSFILIAATNGLKANMERLYTGNEKIWLLRNGYSEKLFFPSTTKYEEFTLVFHGIISKYQDIDLLIELGHLIDKRSLPFKIIVVGQGNQDYKLRGEKIPKSINYLGPQPYVNIPEIISKAHIGLSFRQPGKISEDSFPVKIYEYIGVSVPVIVTPASEAGNYVVENKIGYQYDPKQKEILLEKIIEISANTLLYNQLVSNLRKVRGQFSREKNSQDLVSFILTKIHNGSVN